jgi:hypothetical protein
LKQIIIDIDEEGEVQIETRGFNGKVCIEESNLSRSYLVKRPQINLTPAYYVKTNRQLNSICNCADDK